MAVNREDLIACLNDLVETCRDAEKGFRSAAEHVRDENLKAYFQRISYQRAQFASELQAEVRQLRDKTTTNGGNVSGMFYRGWMNIRAAVMGGDDSIISECEWGEDAALRNYERVLKQNLPPNVLPVVKHQYSQIKEVHNRIRNMEKKAA